MGQPKEVGHPDHHSKVLVMIIICTTTSMLIIFSTTMLINRLILSAEKKKAETKRSLANAGKSRFDDYQDYEDDLDHHFMHRI